ncbi:MAG TPA: GNAT family N-acetyltransferase [Acidimicrobiales bacterium]|nr:GNAT family N-acetyltransferase [Acidimicrobiales bacterium]
MTPGGFQMDEIDLRTADDDLLAELNDFNNRVVAEIRPDDPPTPVEQAIAAVRNLPDFVDVAVFAARDASGGLVAIGQGVVGRTGENEHLIQVNIEVTPDARRQGIGTALLARLAEVAEKEGRRLVLGSTNGRVPAGDAFAQRVGAEAGLADHVNRLVIADLDRTLIRRWAEEGPKRAPAYELVTFDGRWPDDQVQALVDVMTVINSAPHDDLEVEDQHFTVEQWRQQEASLEAAGNVHWTIVASELSTGVFAGMTDVVWNPARPKTVQQNLTVVHPDHRGHGLGKWLKAVMLERVLIERPEVEDVRTSNADSNEAMLAINHELGFGPWISRTVWQVPLDRVRDYVQSRGDVGR